MEKFKNEAEIKRWLASRLKVITEVIVDEIVKMNSKEVQKIVYDAYNPQFYQRTNEGENFKSAWGKQKISIDYEKGKAEGEFGYQPEKLSVSKLAFQHGSNYQDYDVRPHLAEIIYDGLSGPLFGYGPWCKKRDAWEKLMEHITKDQMRKWIKEGARKAGLKIEF